jgi:hypothetical protein
MGCGGSVASKYPAGPAPPRAENRVEPAAIEVATTVMTPKLPVQPMGDIDAPIQRGLSLSYGSCTIPGYDPARPRKPNQDDSLIVEQFQHQSQSFFAVMDGHGTAGHEVARYAKRKLHKRLAKTLLKAGSITQAIDEAFTRTHDDLCSSKVCAHRYRCSPRAARRSARGRCCDHPRLRCCRCHIAGAPLQQQQPLRHTSISPAPR